MAQLVIPDELDNLVYGAMGLEPPSVDTPQKSADGQPNYVMETPKQNEEEQKVTTDQKGELKTPGASTAAPKMGIAPTTPQPDLPQAQPAMPMYGGVNVGKSKPPMMGQPIAPATAQADETAYKADNALATNKDARMKILSAPLPADAMGQAARTSALAQLRLESQELNHEKAQNSLDFERSQPRGFFSHLIHPFMGYREDLQQLQLNKQGHEMTAEEGQQQQLNTEASKAATPRTPDLAALDARVAQNKAKGMTDSDATVEAYNWMKQTAQDVKPDKTESIDQMIAGAAQKARGEGRDPNTDPDVMAYTKVKQGLEKPDSAAKIKKDFEDTIARVSGEGLPTSPEALPRSIDRAKSLSAEERAAAHGYMAANSTPASSVQVHVEGAQGVASGKAAGNYYHWIGSDGETHVGKGNEVPQGVEAVPIGDEKKFSEYQGESHMSNIVQQSLNRIHQDINDHPEIFDSLAARSILATTLEQIDRTSAGILIAGTGGSIPLPSGLGDLINTALQNKGLDHTTAEAVKQYVADYKAMKDKAIVMQMEMQGGKIGRGSSQAFKSITDQIPNGATADSKTAKRQMKDLQETQDELSKKYGNYGDYKKIAPYGQEQSSGGGGGAPTKYKVGDTIYQGGHPFKVTKVDPNGKVTGAE